MEHKEPHGPGGGRNEVGAGRWDVEGSGDGREGRRNTREEEVGKAKERRKKAGKFIQTRLLAVEHF